MNGITRGIQMLADFLKLLVAAIEHKNVEAIGDGVSVAKGWLRETVTEGGVLRFSGLALLLGTDPWKDSRMMFQAFKEKWQGKL